MTWHPTARLARVRITTKSFLSSLAWFWIGKLDLKKQSLFRSSHQRYSIRKVFSNISQNSQENTCARVFWHRCFPVNFARFVRTPFVTEHLRKTASVYSDYIFWKTWHLLCHLERIRKVLIWFCSKHAQEKAFYHCV